MTSTSSPLGRGHTSYDEIETPAAMRADCAAVGRRLERIAEEAVAGAPSLEFADYPRDVPKRDIEIGEAAARIANAIYLE